MTAPDVDHHDERAIRELVSRLRHIPDVYLADRDAFAADYVRWLHDDHWRHIRSRSTRWPTTAPEPHRTMSSERPRPTYSPGRTPKTMPETTPEPDVDHRVKGLGILLEHRDEWWQTDAEWAAERAKDDWLSEEDRLVDHAWYIQYGPKPEDVCRWVNCSFVTVPTDPRMFSTPIGQRDGNGITITRGDVVDGLADSGFKLRLPHE